MARVWLGLACSSCAVRPRASRAAVADRTVDHVASGPSPRWETRCSDCFCLNVYLPRACAAAAAAVLHVPLPCCAGSAAAAWCFSEGVFAVRLCLRVAVPKLSLHIPESCRAMTTGASAHAASVGHGPMHAHGPSLLEARTAAHFR